MTTTRSSLKKQSSFSCPKNPIAKKQSRFRVALPLAIIASLVIAVASQALGENNQRFYGNMERLSEDAGKNYNISQEPQTVCEEHDKQCQFNKDRSYALAMANSFLNYFFDEVENGIDTVINNSPIVHDTTALLMNVNT